MSGTITQTPACSLRVSEQNPATSGGAVGADLCFARVCALVPRLYPQTCPLTFSPIVSASCEVAVCVQIHQQLNLEFKDYRAIPVCLACTRRIFLPLLFFSQTLLRMKRSIAVIISVACWTSWWCGLTAIVFTYLRCCVFERILGLKVWPITANDSGQHFIYPWALKLTNNQHWRLAANLGHHNKGRVLSPLDGIVLSCA